MSLKTKEKKEMMENARRARKVHTRLDTSTLNTPFDTLNVITKLKTKIFLMLSLISKG